jgi:hypothetical protein
MFYLSSGAIDIKNSIKEDEIWQLENPDENLKNSYMELDLRQRIYNSGYSQPIVYDMDCPIEIDHKDASKLRNPNDAKNNLSDVYKITFKEDYDYFYQKWDTVFDKPDYNSLNM